jgi:TorA maturation chaperone TorD
VHAAAALELPSAPTAEEHTDLFVLQLYPYASVYLGPEGMLGGEAGDRVAGFWRALRLAPPAEPDHLAALLSLYARLLEMESQETEPARRNLWRQARRALLWEHLLTWLPPYLHRLESIAPPTYRCWGDLLQRALLEEAEQLGPPDQASLHLRDVAGLADPREEGGEALLKSLLAPVRSGVIVVRTDLSDAARELGLGLRRGERRYVLSALLSQDGPAVLAWLARLARAWAEAHRRQPALLEPVSSFWSARADASARLLQGLAANPEPA